MRSVVAFFVSLVVIVVGLYVYQSEIRTRHELEVLKKSLRELETTPLRPARTVLDNSIPASERGFQGDTPVAVSQNRQDDTPRNAAPKNDGLEETPTIEQVNSVVLNAYDSEKVDPTWAATAAKDLNNLVSKSLPEHSRVFSIQCRTTMCRIEVQHTNQETAQLFLDSGFRDWHGGVLVAAETEKEGSLIQTLIPMRENTIPPYVGL